MKSITCSLVLSFILIGHGYAADMLFVDREPALEPNQQFIYKNNDTGDAIPEYKQDPLFDIQTQKNSLSNLNDQQSNTFFEQATEQKKLAEEHDQEVMDYSILTNGFYENDRIRIYNYTAYNTQQLKNTLLNPTNSNTSGTELTISFGYGMEFKINTLNKIGYEYISSFPYDRGQLLRLYWLRTLTY
ncbi:hypothetical protein [Acinetobacter piscicola]|uniref:hypothetical protein n=1 Tax=Acinetobacter piscicola TaxID=2006115 RepID=UPI001E38D977|nr:hypothetical protein [Acinetobacter piscicola]